MMNAAEAGRPTGRLRDRAYQDMARRARLLEDRLVGGLPVFQFLDQLSHLMDNVGEALLRLAEIEDARLPPGMSPGALSLRTICLQCEGFCRFVILQRNFIRNAKRE